MKKSILLLSIFFFILQFSIGQKLTPPSEGKAKIYFTRTSGYGFLINFKIFDGEKYLGKFNGEQYMVYECDPGIHSIWALSENMSMVYTDLEANRVYFIDAIPKIGAWKANVKLEPLDKKQENSWDEIVKAFNYVRNSKLKTMTIEEIEKEEKKLEKKIEKGIRYISVLNKHKRRPEITPDMYIDIPK